jgi:hypothetical protein
MRVTVHLPGQLLQVRPASFGPSHRDPGVERPRLREVGSGRLAAGLARFRPKYADLLARMIVASIVPRSETVR